MNTGKGKESAGRTAFKPAGFCRERFRMLMKKKRDQWNITPAAGTRTVVLAVLVCLLAAPPLEAFAQQSPEFARTAEEWAALRDDNLEFDEIPALVHEYNTTVLQNAMDYKEFIGKDSTDIADSYYEAADAISERMEYPDEDSPNYAGGVSSYLNSQISYERLMEQGDKNTNDAVTIRLGHERTEANLSKQAQDLMITWWSQYYQLDTLRANIAQAEADLRQTDLRIAAGTATAASRASSEEALLNAQAALASAESSLASTKENLCLMLGWTYGANVNFGNLPEPDPAVIAAIDPAADIARAKDNNYALKTTIRQLENARTQTVKDTLTETRRTSEEYIANSISSMYQAMQLALASYTQSLEALRIQQSAFETASRKKAAGTITQNSFNQINTALVRAQGTAQSRKLDLLKAWVDYNWAVSGLAAN